MIRDGGGVGVVKVTGKPHPVGSPAWRATMGGYVDRIGVSRDRVDGSLGWWAWCGQCMEPVGTDGLHPTWREAMAAAAAHARPSPAGERRHRVRAAHMSAIDPTARAARAMELTALVEVLRATTAGTVRTSAWDGIVAVLDELKAERGARMPVLSGDGVQDQPRHRR